ncbi:hypothetical protein M9Y10_000572 [Tritrichomonas musculus]|uniref:Sel1 repeat family protein n=1 Tax=Tritrichomonas musculus TaxID=1915356 RepID=A0ABR2L693_9EUKA
MKDLLEKAAQYKNPKAFLELGDIYYKGTGVRKNIKEAIKNYEKAAQFNNPDAYCKLGKIYFFGEGVEQDLKKGERYFEYSAQLKNLEDFFYLGYFYSDGILFDINIQKAIYNLEKCTESKYENYLINLPSNGINYESKRYNCFYYRSMNDLGLIYLTVLNDIDKAIENIKEAAFGEYPFAQNNYGLLYQFYLNNQENANYFYHRSSKHQFALAEYNLGYLNEKDGKKRRSD